MLIRTSPWTANPISYRYRTDGAGLQVHPTAMADANGRPIHALPLPVPSYYTFKLHGKRKRRLSTQHGVEADSGSDGNVEYSAVITPDERAQRRLAGQPLDRPPPPTPFPHAPHSRTSGASQLESAHASSRLSSLNTGAPSSLRSQHVAVMLAILHKSLERHEYVRAARTFAALLRTEILGRTIDLRHAGLWGIGAEILARNGSTAADNRVSRKGFEKAKVFYDKLSLQHPWNRSWPNVINAQDFKITMFSLWIYTVCAESKRVEQQYIDHDVPSLSSQQELQAKRWELREAHTIAKEMDSLMGTIPFVDHLELIRLRAMVALWIADLADTVDLLELDVESNNSFQEAVLHERWSNDMEEYHQDSSTRKVNEQAATARNLAKTLFAKLGVDNDIGALAEVETGLDADMV